MDFLKLQNEYSDYIGTTYGISTNTGTSALHLALESLEFNKGDEVIVPQFTMIASAWAVQYAGLHPVFVDCDDDLLIDVEKIEEAITPGKTKAIMPVHIYGRICNMTEIMRIAKKYDLRVIEDACEAQGAMWEGQMVGSFDIGCFSFYWNKIICAEEGGMITTDDTRVYENATDMKNMGFGTEHNYLHRKVGFNYRMSNLQAGLALKSLRNVDKNIEKRKQIESWYNEFLREKYHRSERQVVWVYDINHSHTEGLVKHLNERGIAARHSFKPMMMQPSFNKSGSPLLWRDLNAYKMSRQVCYLPVSIDLDREDIKRISDEVNCYEN